MDVANPRDDDDVSFDGYHKLLGIPKAEQPPNHYRLLGIAMLENDPDVIDIAANKQMNYLHGCANSDYDVVANKLLNEVSAARLCLLDPARKTLYDEELTQSSIEEEQIVTSDRSDEFREEFVVVNKKVKRRAKKNSTMGTLFFYASSLLVALAAAWWLLPFVNNLRNSANDAVVKPSPIEENIVAATPGVITDQVEQKPPESSFSEAIKVDHSRESMADKTATSRPIPSQETLAEPADTPDDELLSEPTMRADADRQSMLADGSGTAVVRPRTDDFRERLHGKLAFNERTSELTILYDFSDVKQLDDFVVDRATISDKRYLAIEPGGTLEHKVRFERAAVAGVVSLSHPEGILLQTTGGLDLSTADRDGLYVDLRWQGLIDEGNVASIGSSTNIPLTFTLQIDGSRVTATMQERSFAGWCSNGIDENLGAFRFGPRQGVFAIKSLTIVGRVDRDWMQNFLE